MASKTFSPSFSFRRLLAALGIISVAAFIGLAGCKRRSEAFKVYEEGRSARRHEKDLVRAEQLLLKSIDMDPGMTQPQIELAEMYLDLSNEGAEWYSEDKAVNHLKETLRLVPNHVGAHYLMGVVAMRRGDFSLALEEFGAARRSMEGPLDVMRPPMWKEVVCLEGILLLDKGDFSRAEADFEEYRSQGRNQKCYYFGMLLAAAKRGENAELERYASWVSSHGEPRESKAYEGLLHIWRGEPGKAIDIFEKRVEQLEGDIPGIDLFTKKRLYQRRHKLYRQILAWAYWKAGRTEDAHALHPGSLEGLDPSAAEIFTLVLSRV